MFLLHLHVHVHTHVRVHVHLHVHLHLHLHVHVHVHLRTCTCTCILDHEVFHLGLSHASFQWINFRVDKELHVQYMYTYVHVLSRLSCWNWLWKWNVHVYIVHVHVWYSMPIRVLPRIFQNCGLFLVIKSASAKRKALYGVGSGARLRPPGICLALHVQVDALWCILRDSRRF